MENVCKLHSLLKTACSMNRIKTALFAVNAKVITYKHMTLKNVY